MDFLKTIDSFSKSLDLFNCKKILIAVSGGVDSLLLLHSLIANGIQVEVAHVDHQTRRNVSAHDKAFVQYICKRWNIPCHVGYFSYRKGNFHDEARQYRQQWLNEIYENFNFDYIATAHHMDDRMETFFLNAFRGSGLSGLISLGWKRGMWVRPFIDLDRELILSCAQNIQLPFVEDESNLKTAYTRNYWRHEVLPAIQKHRLHYKKGIVTTIRNLEVSNGLLNELICKYTDLYVSKKGSISYMKNEALHGLVNAVPLLYLRFRTLGFTMDQIENLIHSKRGARFYSKTHVLEKGKENIIWIKKDEEMILDTMIQGQGSFPLGKDISILVEVISQIPEVRKSGTLYFSADTIQFPLFVRSWKNGDSFAPLGMYGKRKKVKKFFQDIGLSSIEKRLTPLLLYKDEIAAVIPYRVAQDFEASKVGIGEIIAISLMIRTS
ncbi:MAG TPA: tRNA lysidine(34) synthetase TilS [Saprospiraceae bacterium]|nr:tRNA lysidine(34) synthetase TilS [Saprospiraceae bacterium]